MQMWDNRFPDLFQSSNLIDVHNLLKFVIRLYCVAGFSEHKPTRALAFALHGHIDTMAYAVRHCTHSTLVTYRSALTTMSFYLFATKVACEAAKKSNK